MELSILHIDDEPDVLKAAAEIISDTKIGGFTLRVKDSCGFDEGMLKLQQNEYDLVILDLCIGKAASASDKVGEVIFQQIKDRAFIPIVFFTGLPEYVKPQQSNIVRIASKLDGYDSLFAEIDYILKTGFITLKQEIYATVREGLKSYFWNFVHAKSSMIDDLKKDQVSLRYVLLRRLGKTFATEILKNSVDDPDLKKDLAHPIEFYIYPPIDGEFETGDIIKSKNSGDISILLTPACDFILRKDGKRNADKILLVHADKFKETADFKKMTTLKQKEAAALAKGQSLAQLEASQLKNLLGKLIEAMKPGANERFFFLPPTPFIDAMLIDFQNKSSISYDDLETNYDVIASLDDPISQAVLSSYARYYSRIGYPDLDREYALNKI